MLLAEAFRGRGRGKARRAKVLPRSMHFLTSHRARSSSVRASCRGAPRITRVQPRVAVVVPRVPLPYRRFGHEEDTVRGNTNPADKSLHLLHIRLLRNHKLRVHVCLCSARGKLRARGGGGEWNLENRIFLQEFSQYPVRQKRCVCVRISCWVDTCN